MHHYVLTKRKLLEQVKKKLKQYEMTHQELAAALNLFIPEEDPKLDEGKSGAVQIGRWLMGKVDPATHITLAMLAFIQTLRPPRAHSSVHSSTKPTLTQQTKENTCDQTEKTTEQKTNGVRYIFLDQEHSESSATSSI
jgi:hypothetical protein